MKKVKILLVMVCFFIGCKKDTRLLLPNHNYRVANLKSIATMNNDLETLFPGQTQKVHIYLDEKSKIGELAVDGCEMFRNGSSVTVTNNVTVIVNGNQNVWISSGNGFYDYGGYDYTYSRTSYQFAFAYHENFKKLVMNFNVDPRYYGTPIANVLRDLSKGSYQIGDMTGIPQMPDQSVSLSNGYYEFVASKMD